MRINRPRGMSSSFNPNSDDLLSCAYCHAAPGGPYFFNLLDENGSNQQLKRCTRCYSVAYCNRKCQSKHYKVHRDECWRLARERSREIEKEHRKQAQVSLPDLSVCGFCRAADDPNDETSSLKRCTRCM